MRLLLLLLLVLSGNKLLCFVTVVVGDYNVSTITTYLTSKAPITYRYSTGVYKDIQLNLSVHNVTSTFFEVSWEKLNHDYGLITEGYILLINCSSKIKEDECKNGSCSEVKYKLDANATKFIFDHAKPFSNYQVTVQPVIHVDTGIPNTIQVTTNEEFPEKPQNLLVSQLRSSQILLLNWKRPNCIQGRLLHYHVSIECLKSNNGDSCPCPQDNVVKFTVPGSQTAANISGVQPYSVYKIGVAAETGRGIGKFQKMVFTSAEDLPGSPKNVYVEEIDSSTFILNWESPVCSWGNITDYHVRITCVKSFNGPDCPCLPSSSGYFTVPATQTTLKFNNALPFSEYKISVAAETTEGVGDATEITHNTMESKPDSPKELNVDEDDSAILILNWEAPVCSWGNITYYHINIDCVESMSGPNCPCLQSNDANLRVPASQTTLNFTSAKPFSDYKIYVSAETKEGIGEPKQVNYSTPESIPGSPEELNVDEIDSATLLLNWEPPVCSLGILTHYHINIECVESMNGPSCPCLLKNSANHIIPASQTTLSFTNSLPFSEYKISVAAETREGIGKPKEERYKTQESLPGSPKELNVDEIDSATLILKWEPPVCSLGNLTHYHIIIECVESMSGPSCPCLLINSANHTVPALQTTLSFNNSKPFSEYKISVAAETKEGIGKLKEERYRTQESIPDSPKELYVDEIDAATLFLKWESPVCSFGNLTHYYIHIKCVESMSGPSCPCLQINSANHTVPASQTTLSFSNSKPFSIYKISVTAETIKGSGKPKEYTHKTQESIPDAPLDLTVSSDISIEWEEPLCTNGNLYAYYINIIFVSSVEESEYCLSEASKTFTYEVITTERRFLFTEKMPYSFYNISLFAANGAGNGSNTVQHITSSPAILGELQYLYVNTINSEAVNIIWQVPCPITDEINKYYINIAGFRPNYEYDIKMYEVSTFTYYLNISDLKPEFKYNLTMNANGKTTGKGRDTTKYFQQPAGVPVVLGNFSKELASSPLDTSDPTTQALITVPASLFVSTNGEIQYYAIFVALNSLGQNSTSGNLQNPIDSLYCNETWPSYSYWSDVTEKGIQFSEYQATPDCWEPLITDEVFTYVLGTDKPCESNDYCNGPLHPYTEYTFKVRAFTSHGYQDTDVIKFQTDSEVAVGLALGLVFGFLIIGAILFGLVMYRKGQISCSVADIFRKDNTRDVRPRPIPIKNFSKHCELLLDIPGRLNSEFQLLATLCVDINDTNTFSVGRLPDNKRKNRYINILPFDANRVKLDIVDDDPSSDYINASFIKGYSTNTEYVATQGPKEETVKDFWRMVYQYGVKLIVMLTQLEEQGKVKCHQYYPNLRESAKYGDITVRCTTELHFSIYTSRTVILLKGKERRTVVQLHFQEWPDFGCPATTNVMLQFCQIVRHQILLTNQGLCLVHCSAGVGRTGTLIALDILLQHVRENKNIDIFGTVYNLRKQRANMVQSEAQYAYIYKCMRDTLGESTHSKHDHKITSPLEPIYESIGPSLNSPLHNSLRRSKRKSNYRDNEYEL